MEDRGGGLVRGLENVFLDALSTYVGPIVEGLYEGGKAHHTFYRPTTNYVTTHHYFSDYTFFSSGIVYNLS